MKKRLLMPTLLLLTACGAGPFSNPIKQTINVTLSPNTVTLAPGESQRVQVTGTAAGTTEFISGLTIEPQDVPAGLSVTPSPGMLTVSVKSDASAGQYTVPINVKVFGGAGQASLAVNVAPKTVPAYTVTLTPASPSLVQGESVRVSIQASRGTASASEVRLVSVTGALTTTVDPKDPLGFTIAASATQTVGTYALQVTTTDGSQTLVTPAMVSVTAKATP